VKRFSLKIITKRELEQLDKTTAEVKKNNITREKRPFIVIKKD
jgi:hypothetical protein